MSKKNPVGYFEKVLVVDAETTGLFFNSDTPDINLKTGDYYQPISWGLIVAEAKTLEPVEELYVEIKWDGTSLWEQGAERVHGLSKAYLAESGMDEEEAVVEIAELILKWWGPDLPICFAGHNVATFDVPFMRRMMARHQVPIKVGNRHIDSFSVAQTAYNAFNSDDAFSFFGMADRDPTKHNALEDARNTLTALRTVKQLFGNYILPNL